VEKSEEGKLDNLKSTLCPICHPPITKTANRRSTILKAKKLGHLSGQTCENRKREGTLQIEKLEKERREKGNTIRVEKCDNYSSLLSSPSSNLRWRWRTSSDIIVGWSSSLVVWRRRGSTGRRRRTGIRFSII